MEGIDIREAILHAKQIAEDGGCPAGSGDCAYQHDKLADWLTELKAYKDTGLTPEEITTAEKNEPLTLEELREMGRRCEGVYVAHIDGSPVFRDQKYCAAVLDFSPAFGSTVLHVHAIYGDRLTLWEDEYGKTWLAYRRKPGDNAAPVPMTNADRIRAMSDEELAQCISELSDYTLCEIFCDNKCALVGPDCHTKILDWLKQPAEATQ